MSESFVVRKRWLNIAKVTFLTTLGDGQNHEELIDNITARVEELTDEIVDFSIECHELQGGYISHAIHGAELVPKKVSVSRFRKAIFEAWDHKCAYCGEPADTLDHVLAKSKGGLTMRNNLVAACKDCNGSKSSSPVWSWFRAQSFWTQHRELDLVQYTGIIPPDYTLVDGDDWDEEEESFT